MYEWSWGIFAKKSEIHDPGGPDTVVSPSALFFFLLKVCVLVSSRFQNACDAPDKQAICFNNCVPFVC